MSARHPLTVNVVRRSALLRALAGLGTLMIAAPVIMLVAYAAAAVAIGVIVVAIVVTVHHVATGRPVITPAQAVARYDAHNDAAARAHRARMDAIRGR